MAHKKLKTFVGRTVTAEGELKRVERQAIFIETSGSLRMFMEVPEYVSDLIPEFEHGREVKLETPETGPGRIYGRDPERVQQGFYALCDRYVAEIMALQLEDRILVNVSTARGHFDKCDVALKFGMERYHFDPRKSSYYAWRGTPTESLRKVYATVEDRVILPYSDELWDKLVGMRTALQRAIEQIEAVVRGENFAQRLLASNGIPSLTHNPED